MASAEQLQVLQEMFRCAQQAGHKWPAAAACEAMDETAWGKDFPAGSYNVLGIKAYPGWTGPTVTADGTEQNPNGSWTGPQVDRWCKFESFVDCFKEQMLILAEPRYAAAMEAPTIEEYIVAECAIWSTSQQKGQAVLEIYRAHRDILEPQEPTE